MFLWCSVAEILSFFLNLNWNLKFWISYIVILIWGLWFTWIWNLYPSVRVQSTVVVSNFLEKFEMATTFLFMAVHISIFDMLFVYAPKLSGTQLDSVKTCGSWEYEGSVSDTFGALDLLYDMPPKNFLMPHDQLELLYKLAFVRILIALSIAEKIKFICRSVSWVTFGRLTSRSYKSGTKGLRKKWLK